MAGRRGKAAELKGTLCILTVNYFCFTKRTTLRVECKVYGMELTLASAPERLATSIDLILGLRHTD